MNATYKLARYEAHYRRWLKAVVENNPLVHEPSEAEYELTSDIERWMADKIRRKIEDESSK